MCRLSMVRPHPAFLLAATLFWTCIASGQQADDLSSTAAPVESRQGSVKVSVFYLTNRRRDDGKPVAETYGGERGEAHFGRCAVEFTPIAIINELASRMPFYLKHETRLISRAEQVTPGRFWDELRAAVGRVSSGAVALFVHGYNYGFERACRMGAELQRSLQDKATMVLFSWPSNGLPTDYVPDRADIEWSVPLLADFIGQLGDSVGTANVQVVAHSLGSRGVILALQRLGAERHERPAIGRLVLLAPDFDAQTFVELLPGLAPLAGDITLYASSKDTPLKLSRQLNGNPRLGEAGEYLTVVESMDTIDVSSAGRYQITGHEYFYYHPRVTADLVTLLSTGARAAERAGLQARMRNGVRYWEFMSAARDEGAAVGLDD